MILLEEESPLRGVTAFVEDDGRTVWLYLRGEGRQRAMWLANRIAACDGDDEEARASGVAPRMPRTATRHPDGRGPLGAVELVWLDDGEDLVLLEDGAPLAALVTDSGTPSPYARDAVRATPWASPLDADAIAPRLAEGRATWSGWRTAAAERTWRDLRDAQLAALESRLGAHVEYLALDGGRFPPLAVARFAMPDADVFCTIGMSAFAMPASAGARVEIAVAAPSGAPWPPGVLGWLARWPWKHGAFLADGHVVVAPALNATWLAPDSSGVLLTRLPPPDGATPVPAIDRLWVVPLTLDELRAAELTGAASLLATLPARGKTFVSR